MKAKQPQINPAWIAADPRKTGYHLVMLTWAGASMESSTRELLACLQAERLEDQARAARIRATLPAEPYTRQQLELVTRAPKTKAEREFYRQWGYLPTWRKIE